MKLYKHQKEAVEWMKDIENDKTKKGGCLLHDMGLGKTLTMLTLIKDNPLKSIIICPSALKSQWKEQVILHYPQFEKYVQVFKKNQSIEPINKIFIFSYDFFSNKKNNFLDIFKKIDIYRVIIDESHMLRNSRTNRFQSILYNVNAKNINNRWLVTGTPFNNKIEDLISIDKLLHGDGYDSLFWSDVKKKPLQEASLIMKDWLSKISSRKTLQDTDVKLPSIFFYKHFIEQKNNSTYKDCKKEAIHLFNDSENKKHKNINILKKISMLRQSLLDPYMIDKTIKTDSEKYKYIYQRLNTIKKGDKVIVFSFFKHMLQKLYNSMKSEGNCLFINGNTDINIRGDILDTFKTDSSKKILFMTTTTGGTGLDISIANHVILCEPHFNPYLEKQIFCRVHRIGQPKICHVHCIYTINTIEEWIYLLQRKKEVMGNIILGENNSNTVPSETDIRELFKYMMSNVYTKNDMESDNILSDTLDQCDILNKENKEYILIKKNCENFKKYMMK